MSNHMPRDHDPRIPVRPLRPGEVPATGTTLLVEGEMPDGGTVAATGGVELLG